MKKKEKTSNNVIRKELRIFGVILGTLLLAAAAYLTYIYLAFGRIPDHQVLEIDEGTNTLPDANKTFTALSYNLGFGAYSPDFTFFMDGGKESVGRSPEEITSNLNGAASLCKERNPDFLLLQELDLDSTRSYHMNQRKLIRPQFPDYDEVFAVNYDSPYLFYPFLQPIGKSKAGLSTYSRANIQSAVRRSLPITTKLSKVLDLDRCYLVSEIPLDNGKSLYIYNAHLMAYGGDSAIRGKQVDMLFSDMNEKREAGHYVLCGGDFNHELIEGVMQQFNPASEPLKWLAAFPYEQLPATILFAKDYVGEMLPTVRQCSIPYTRGVSLVSIIDGFFYSDNIQVVSVENIDAQFAYSDHNPVQISFRLLPQDEPK